jgi:hypothetical protein
LGCLLSFWVNPVSVMDQGVETVLDIIQHFWDLHIYTLCALNTVPESAVTLGWGEKVWKEEREKGIEKEVKWEAARRKRIE